MFSNVNQVIESLRVCERENSSLVIDWSRSCYAEEPSVNTWCDFFVWDKTDEMALRAGELANFPVLTHTPDLVVAPRGRHRDYLMPPKDRVLVKGLIDRHLRLQPRLVDRLETLHQKLCAGKRTIGVHVRGPGRRSGGISRHIVAMQWKWPGVRVPPYRVYFHALDRLLDSGKYDQILLCTDSLAVRERFIARYGMKRFVWTDADLSAEGEMHARPATHRFSKRKLGDDALIEAFMLSRAQFLLHGNSNLTNFVLCNAPELPSYDVYQRYYDGQAWESVLVDRLTAVKNAPRRYWRGFVRLANRTQMRQSRR